MKPPSASRPAPSGEPPSTPWPSASSNSPPASRPAPPGEPPSTPRSTASREPPLAPRPAPPSEPLSSRHLLYSPFYIILYIFHHRFTTRPVMLNDVAGSITFSLSSPDSFTSITGAQGEPALICEKYKKPMADLPFLVFSSKCQSSATVQATLMKSVSDCLDRDIHTSGLLVVIL